MEWWWRDYPERDIEYVSYYPPSIGPLTNAELWEKTDYQSSKYLGVYIHVPFCQTMCPFCPYNKFKLDAELLECFVRAVCAEIKIYGERQECQNRLVPFVYFGGGTPSVLSAKQMSDILESLHRHFYIAEDVEISIEAHPRTVSYEYLYDLHTLGVNRVSMGIQSFQPHGLEVIHAHHTPQQAVRAIQSARKANITTIGIDLLYALPNQALNEWEKDLYEAVRIEVDHISCYRIMIDPAGKIGAEIRNGHVPPQPDETMEVQMAQVALNLLEDAGYRHYKSCSSCGYDLARPGKECRYEFLHVAAPQTEYLALGAGAAGFVNNCVYWTIHTLPEYLTALSQNSLPILAGKRLDTLEAMARYMVLGVKCLRVPKQDFAERFGQPLDQVFGAELQTLIEAGLVAQNESFVWVTQKGKMFGDNISKTFYSPENWRIPQPQAVELQLLSKTLLGNH